MISGLCPLGNFCNFFRENNEKCDNQKCLEKFKSCYAYRDLIEYLKEIIK